MNLRALAYQRLFHWVVLSFLWIYYPIITSTISLQFKVQRKEIYELTCLTADSTVSAFWASSVQCIDARVKVKLTCR